MEYIGHVVHYQGERDGGAFVPWTVDWTHTARAMQQSRPGATVCIEPVKEVPEWAEES